MPVGDAGEVVCDWAYVGEHVLGMWACARVPKYDDKSVSEQNCVPERLSMGLESGGSRTLIVLVTKGAVWVLAEKRPPRGSLTPEGWCLRRR